MKKIWQVVPAATDVVAAAVARPVTAAAAVRDAVAVASAWAARIVAAAAAAEALGAGAAMVVAGGVSAARLAAAGLVALSICAAAALRAEPPGLAIDSWPVAAVCRPGAPGSAARAGEASGLALLRPAAPPASGSGGDLYQATMDMADWGGHFSRYRLPAAVGGASAVAWDAGALLTGTATSPPIPAPERRQIYTAIVQPDGALTTVPFQWPALSVAQQTLLDLEDHAGEQRLAYLRGDRSLEGIQFRRRGSILGDAVHSTPVHVALPDRAATVYLGANDGMLHAFDASSGIERFAYVPDALMAGLPRLTDPVYVHRAYVDGPASAGQASIDGGTRTILLSAMGGGAPGVFALDVTDPAHFADGLGALWEFTSRDDPLMGNVTTLPQIARVRTRRDVYRHFAIVASGINSGGPGALFLLALDKPRDQGWRLNDNYFRIRTPASDALSAPVLLNDSDGALRYAYAGDLQGNLWRFDFSGSAPWTKTLLFVARDAEGHRQPITQTPLLAFANPRGYMVMFGTGRLIERADRAATARQSYYAIIDNLQSPPDIITGRHQLTQRFLDGSDGRMTSGSKGWYVDFTQPGERSVNTGVLTDGAVLFNTVLPGADVCSTTRSRSYVLNVISGLPDEGSVTTASTHDAPITGLMLPDYVPTPMLLPQSVTHSGPDAIGRVRQEKTYAVVQAGSGGALTVSGSMTATRRTGRLSWREIVNWRELHEAAR